MTNVRPVFAVGQIEANLIQFVDIIDFEHPMEETPDGSSISDFWDDMHAGFWCDDELDDNDQPFDFDDIPF